MAAGLGFKNFTTGEVLTAGDVNGYLMQGVLVFADAAARTAAITSPQEGQVSFLKDTNSTEYYSGSAWVAVGGSVPTSLQFTAGKNALINADFRFNQRNFTSNTANASYNFDRWLQQNSGGSFTVTPQTFTAGAAPVAGYEGINFVRGITATQSAAGDYAIISQRIEDVRTDSGTTVAISFWAKANTGTPKIGVELVQNFGSGGSPSSAVSTPFGAVTLSTSWARYTVTGSIPSISGKTIGTTANTSYLELNLWTSAGATNATKASSIGIQNFTADVWGVQLEQGSTATSFQTATGTIQGELAACQRYYWRTTPGTNPGGLGSFGTAKSTTAANFQIQNPVVMRITPTSVDYASIVVFDTVNGFALSSISIGGVVNASSYMSSIEVGVTSGLTQFRPYFLYTNSATGYLGFNAEL
jgi:hypothetical protein